MLNVPSPHALRALLAHLSCGADRADRRQLGRAAARVRVRVRVRPACGRRAELAAHLEAGGGAQAAHYISAARAHLALDGAFTLADVSAGTITPAYLPQARLLALLGAEAAALHYRAPAAHCAGQRAPGAGTPPSLRAAAGACVHCACSPPCRRSSEGCTSCTPRLRTVPRLDVLRRVPQAHFARLPAAVSAPWSVTLRLSTALWARTALTALPLSPCACV